MFGSTRRADAHVFFGSARRADALLFGLALLGAGYFHQGGGWNQNARFALVRSIVEDQTFFIDSHLIYQRGETNPEQLVRLPTHSGNFRAGGRDLALAWRSHSGALLPVDPTAAGVRTLVAVEDVAASGDVAYFGGHFHPNKAPGTSFLAVPGYALVRALESAFSLNPDSWRTLTWNAWLVSLLSVGLASALGAVLVLRLGRTIASEKSARLAAVTFAFATMAWPYATFLFEHNLIATLLLAATYSVERARALREQGAASRGVGWIHAVGLLTGLAAITNYTMAALVPMFALFLFVRVGATRDLWWMALGLLWPFVAICGYNQICFGTPFTTNYAYQSALFVNEDRLLGVFARPRSDVALLLLFSPFRGLFFSSPVLLAGVVAMAVSWRQGAHRPLVALIASVGAFLLLLNASFNGWDGGWTAVPRYLGPAMGLLGVALALAYERWRSITTALAAVAFLVQGLLTSVDPQVPIGDVGTAGVAVSKVFPIDPIARYVLPLFVRDQAWPMLHESIEDSVARSARVARARGATASEVETQAVTLRSELLARVQKQDPSPFPLAAVTGPVSANPIGVYEGAYFQLFSPGSEQARGNSFNLGELLFPQSRFSLLPLLLLGGLLLALLLSEEESASHADAQGQRP